MKHGLSGYTNERCRCTVCTEAQRQYHTGYRARAVERRTDPNFILRHGDFSTYNNHRCRCEPCVEAARVYRQAHRVAS